MTKGLQKKSYNPMYKTTFFTIITIICLGLTPSNALELPYHINPIYHSCHRAIPPIWPTDTVGEGQTEMKSPTSSQNNNVLSDSMFRPDTQHPNHLIHTYRPSPVEDFFYDWDTAVVDPYDFDIKEITYDFPVCLFISHEDQYALPLKTMYRTSSFGPRWGRHHKGIDLDLNVGDTVFNMFDGMVRISTYSKSFGHFVVIRHLNGLETLYAHLSQRNLSGGDIVKAGECVGLGGSTGRSTGPHLHFEVRYMGVAFDPENLLSLTNQDITSEEITITPDLFGYLSYQKGKGKNSNSAYHTIQNGETISSIARKYNTSVNQICVINGIRPNTIIRAGKTIRVR